jgi:hypothetical protein
MSEVAQDIHFLRANRQVTVGDLKIGAGNFRVEEDTATCALWFYVRDQPELNRHERVHKGQVVDIGGFRVQVRDVRLTDADTEFVELAVASL